MVKNPKNFIQKIHNSSKRNYLNRMNLKKPIIMNEAKKYSKKYWDGSRSEGYGGYKYISGYWKGLAKKSGIKIGDIISNFKTENLERPNKAVIYPFAAFLLFIFGLLNYRRS